MRDILIGKEISIFLTEALGKSIFYTVTQNIHLIFAYIHRWISGKTDKWVNG